MEKQEFLLQPTLVIFVLLALILTSQPLMASAAPATQQLIQIFSPLPGEAIQGLVPIIGTIDIEGFESYDLSFSFAHEESSSWFPIAKSRDMIIQGLIGEWDTTKLTDNYYDIRLKVYRQNDSPLELIVEGLRVRNYTQIETSTPNLTPTTPENQPIAVPTIANDTSITPETSSALITPTNLSPNPIEIKLNLIQNSAIKGIIIIILSFGLLLFYSYFTNTKEK